MEQKQKYLLYYQTKVCYPLRHPIVKALFPLQSNFNWKVPIKIVTNFYLDLVESFGFEILMFVDFLKFFRIFCSNLVFIRVFDNHNIFWHFNFLLFILPERKAVDNS